MPSIVKINIQTGARTAREMTESESALLNVPETHEQIAAGAIRKLDSIDLASIRSMREWIAMQPTAPQMLKDKEAEAILERAKLTP